MVGTKQRVIATILLGLAPRRRIGPAMRFFDLLFDGYIGATPQILVSGALIDIPRRSLAGRGPLLQIPVRRRADFHQPIRLQRAENAVRQTVSSHRLYVMDRRQKQKLERDLERYHALLKLATDERAAAALRQLIRETQGRLNHTNNSEQPTPQIRDDNQSPAERLGSGGLD